MPTKLSCVRRSTRPARTASARCQHARWIGVAPGVGRGRRLTASPRAGRGGDVYLVVRARLFERARERCPHACVRSGGVDDLRRRRAARRAAGSARAADGPHRTSSRRAASVGDAHGRAASRGEPSAAVAPSGPGRAQEASRPSVNRRQRTTRRHASQQAPLAARGLAHESPRSPRDASGLLTQHRDRDRTRRT